jgi:hypothetical protein
MPLRSASKAYLAPQALGPPCHTPRHRKGTRRLPHVRRVHGPCQPHPTRTVSPLTDLLPEHTAPERLYLEAKFAALMSYTYCISRRNFRGGMHLRVR